MRPTEYRIPIPEKLTLVDSGDIFVDVRKTVVGTSVHLVIDDAVLSDIGARGIQTAVDNLGRYLVSKHLEDRMDAICTDSWVRGVVEDELRSVVRGWTKEYADNILMMYNRIIQWRIEQDDEDD